MIFRKTLRFDSSSSSALISRVLQQLHGFSPTSSLSLINHSLSLHFLTRYTSFGLDFEAYSTPLQISRRFFINNMIYHVLWGISKGHLFQDFVMNFSAKSWVLLNYKRGSSFRGQAHLSISTSVIFEISISLFLCLSHCCEFLKFFSVLVMLIAGISIIQASQVSGVTINFS